MERPTHASFCHPRQSGFTLVETGVVLILVGLLLGGLLKGPELAHSARVKMLARDFGSIAVQLDAYQDRFKALPGDDARADANVGGTPAGTPPAPAQRGNGRIEGAWNSRTPTDESYLFWQHLRNARLTVGSTDAAAIDSYLPRNAEGGRLGVSSTLAAGWAAAYHVCSANINGRFARQIDLQLDDGNTATGSVRVFANDAGDGSETPPVLANLTAIADANLYTVCAAY
jgi:type II secretory pathway pseudopilin PulG